MHNMEVLLSRIRLLNLDVYKSSDIPFNSTIRKMAEMDLHLWSQLQVTLARVKKKQYDVVIRQFLALRGKLFVTTSFDYTHAPQLPANQLCVAFARKVLKPHEALCQLLMPTISRVYGTHFMPDDVVSATSESEDDPFLWENYLIHVDGRSLVYIPGLYQISARDPDFLFSPKPELLELTAEDYERIRTVAGVASERCFAQLKEIYRITHDEKNSVGNELRELQRALVASSKQSSGSELQANMFHLRRPIFDFYRLWIALPRSQKNKISFYVSQAEGRTLESYLLFLFLHAKESCPEINITENQYQRVIRESIFPCTDLIAQSLDDILKANLDLFEISFSGEQKDLQRNSLPTTSDLELSHSMLKVSLLCRCPIRGLNDRQCVMRFPFAMVLSSHFFDRAFVAKIYSLITATKSAEDVASILYFLQSPDQQACYLRRLAPGSSLTDFIYDPCEMIITIVNRLLPENWQIFFETMNKAVPGLQLNQSNLIDILNFVSKKQWKELIRVMHPCLVSLFSKEAMIANFFSEMFYHQYTVDQTYELFHDALDSVLSDPKNIIHLLRYSHSATWSTLMRALNTLFEAHCKNKEFIINVLQQLNSDKHKIEFLQVLFHRFSDKIRMKPLNMVSVMNLLSFESYREFLNLLSSDHLKFIKSAKELAAFLQLLNHSQRQLVFIRKIQNFSLPMEVSMPSFYYLVRKFPEARSNFISIFLKDIPKWIGEMMVIANNSSESIFKRGEAKVMFNFFVNHILSDVFLYQNLRQQCPSLLCGSSGLIDNIVDKMAKMRSDASQDQLDACFSIMTILQAFLKTPMDCHVFAHELQEYVGKNFFDDLFANTNLVMSQGKMRAEFQTNDVSVGSRSFCSSQFFSQAKIQQSHTPPVSSERNSL